MKPIQIRYQLSKRLLVDKSPSTIRKKAKSANPLKWKNFVDLKSSYSDKNEFTFLNLSQYFGSEIDWNYGNYGKLWTYNLNYFDFLNQNNLSQQEGLTLIQNWIANRASIKDGWESYPCSVRIINWIKFLSIHKISVPQINNSLYTQSIYLSKNLEFHLLANHLLENAFALLFASFFFEDNKLFTKAKTLLEKELDEQILSDGAHFELSPMYHQLVLFRILDCYQLLHFNPRFECEKLKSKIQKIASRMMAWLQKISFSNGDIPLVNDAAQNINPSTNTLSNYYQLLKLPQPNDIALKDSGYRFFRYPKYELLTDFGHIGPDYQPGHAHADTFNFLLYINGKPIIVDTGTSSYDLGSKRNYERSTSAHNTVVIDNKNSSDTWASFRVGRRAKVFNIFEKEDKIEGSHTGYKNLGVIHHRSFQHSVDQIKIQDKIVAKTYCKAVAFLHFHPQVNIQIKENEILGPDFSIKTSGAKDIQLQDYLFAEEFNLRVPSKKVALFFHEKLETRIHIF